MPHDSEKHYLLTICSIIFFFTGSKLSDSKNKTSERDPSRYFRTDHLNTDLKGRSVRGGAVTVGSQVAKFILQLGSTAILARLLTPADYGLMGMVFVFINFISLFKDLGLSTATIQKDEITHHQVSNLFWVNVGLSSLIMLLTIGLAPVLAWFYGEPRLTLITIVLSSAFIFGGLTVQHQALLRRQMRFTSLAVIDILSMIVGIIVAIVWAVYQQNYWALVFMQLTIPFITMLGAWLACGWRPGLPKRYAGTGSLLSFGGHLTGFNFLNYFSRNLDNILIGWKVGAQELGVYAKAYQLLLMPFDQINRPVAQVALPTLSRLQSEPDRYRAYYQKGVGLLVILGMPLVVFMFVAADKLILTMLGDQWQDAILIFRVLAPAAWIGTFNVATGWVYNSMGRADRQLRWGIVTSTITVIGFLIGIQWGSIGVAASLSITMTALRYPGIVYCFKTSPLKVGDLMEVLWRPTLASGMAGIALYFSNLYVGHPIPLIALILDTLLYGLFYILSWLIIPNGKTIVLDFLRLAKEFRVKPKYRERKNGN